MTLESVLKIFRRGSVDGGAAACVPWAYYRSFLFHQSAWEMEADSDEGSMGTGHF